MTSARWSMKATATVAVAMGLTVVASGCGDDTTEFTAAVEPSATVEDSPPASATSSTSAAPQAEIVDLDEGRVLLHLPQGLSLISSSTITGVFGETIRLWRYKGPSRTVVSIAVSRGPGVVDMLHTESNRPSDVTAFEDREYYESRNELADLLNSKSLGWQIGPDAVIWVTATDLTIDQIADIARQIEVV